MRQPNCAGGSHTFYERVGLSEWAFGGGGGVIPP